MVVVGFFLSCFGLVVVGLDVGGSVVEGAGGLEVAGGVAVTSVGNRFGFIVMEVSGGSDDNCCVVEVASTTHLTCVDLGQPSWTPNCEK